MPESNKEILAKMDAAAEEARTELAKLIASDPDGVGAVAKWAKANYLKAGYKRLAQLLVALEKGE